MFLFCLCALLVVAWAISAHTDVYIIIKCRFCIKKVALCICKVALCDDNVALLYKSGGTSEIKISVLILYFSRFALSLYKSGGTSEIKISELILYFSRFALTLHHKKDKDMPLRLPDKLPAIELLKQENIFVIDNTRGKSQDIRPLRIVILNLMPIKITTETDLVRLLSNTPLQMEICFMKLKSHTSKNTPVEHMMMFYEDFEVLRNRKFDGMIITGAPIEHLDYKDVSYWDEIAEIFAWADSHVTSTMYICWAAQAGLFFHYGVPKYPLQKKMFGIFRQEIKDDRLPLFRGFDDCFYMPQSRHTEVRREDIEKHKGLEIVAESDASGVGIVLADGGRRIFVTGHMEYAPLTLDVEYRRDLGKRNDVEMPVNYYHDNNPELKPMVRWRAHANLMFSNWINYYIYQETPYNINDIGGKP